MVDIFDEVDEDLRAERAQNFLKRYAALIVAAAVLMVAAVGGWQAWNWYRQRQDVAAANAYLAAMSLADAIPAGADAAMHVPAIAAFEKVVATAPSGYRALALLRLAALQANAGHAAAAAAAWNTLAADGDADPLLRDLANLLWAQQGIDNGDPALVAARLKALTTADNPWRPIAQEYLALLDIRIGKTDDARTMLRELAADASAPEGVRTRAGGLLARLGG